MFREKSNFFNFMYIEDNYAYLKKFSLFRFESSIEILLKEHKVFLLYILKKFIPQKIHCSFACQLFWLLIPLLPFIFIDEKERWKLNRKFLRLLCALPRIRCEHLKDILSFFTRLTTSIENKNISIYYKQNFMYKSFFYISFVGII